MNKFAKLVQILDGGDHVGPARRAVAAIVASSDEPVCFGGAFERSALHLAAIHGRCAVGRMLMREFGIPPDARRLRNTATPLYDAVRCGHLEFARMLIEHGADVRAVMWSGWTPLHHAAFWHRSDCMALLLDAGASALAANDDGERPIDVIDERERAPPAVRSRLVRWTAAQNQPWSPGAHPLWPRAVRARLVALLVLARARRSRRRPLVAGLGELPAELVLLLLARIAPL